MEESPVRPRKRPAGRARKVVGVGSVAGFAALAGVIGAATAGKIEVPSVSATGDLPAPTTQQRPVPALPSQRTRRSATQSPSGEQPRVGRPQSSSHSS